MPILSRFFGIIVFMFWREHQSPHFHVNMEMMKGLLKFKVWTFIA